MMDVYKPTAEELAVATELTEFANKITSGASDDPLTGEFSAGYEMACASVAEMLRDRADAILAGGA